MDCSITGFGCLHYLVEGRRILRRSLSGGFGFGLLIRARAVSVIASDRKWFALGKGADFDLAIGFLVLD